MKYYIKKYQEPYEPLNKNYPEEVMKYWWQGDDKKFKEAVKNYDNYYGTILPEAEITGSKTTPTKTSDWTSEHNVAEDNKKYEQAHQAESQKIASAVSNKMNEVGNTIGTTALIGGMTIPALAASPVAFVGGLLGSVLGAKATDKIVDWGTNGKYNTWADLLVDKADTKYINHNIAEILNPGALVGGTVGGIFTKPAASWAYRNGKYAYNTKFKGVAKGGDMSEYVPQTIKNQVESGIQGTKDQLKELGMLNLPNSKITYKNAPIYNSFLDNIGNITIGFDSQTLRNPFKFYKAYIGSSKPGLTYNFVGGHEYAHTVHPTKIGLYSEEGIPITSTTVGTPREFPIGERSLVKNNNNKLSVIDEYVTADKQLLEADLFKDINVPRKNIMKGLPNKSHNQAHLRAPQELDADLYALKNLGYIKDGKISDKGLQFLMERHNLSKEGVLNTITDLNTIGYGNAITGQPINSQYIPKPESINMGFAGAPDRFGIKPSKLTEAERLGIPKGDRNNYLIGSTADPSYYSALGLGNNKYTQALRDFHFNQTIPNNTFNGQTFVHSTNSEFNTFNKSFFGRTDDGYHGKGFYFSTTRPASKAHKQSGVITGPHGEIPIMSYGKNKMYVYLKGTPFEVKTSTYNYFNQPDELGVALTKGTIDKPVIAEIITGNPNNIKLSNAITYDDFGNIIPLSKRDNFNISDIRYKQGGPIRIKEKNKGKFTESAKRAGKSVQEHARDVVNNPKATKLQKKRAQFALNTKKFKH